MFASGKARAWIDWDEKRSELTKVVLPFQAIETVNETRKKTMDSFIPKIPLEDSYNYLIWGDNKLVMSSLLPKFEGKINLIYIDPPFATGADPTMNIIFEGEEITKLPSAIELKAYHDTWGQGLASYLQMMYDRVILMRQLLAETGTIYVHLDSRVSHYVKVILDEIFGRENFVSEIVWKRRSGIVDQKRTFGSSTDTIFLFSKSENYAYNRQYTKADTEEYILERFKYVDENGRRYRLSNLVNPGFRPTLVYEYKGYQPPPNGWAISKEKMEQFDREGRLHFPKDKNQRIQRKQFLDEWKGRPIQNLWDDIYQINPMAKERLDYPTQKPEALVERIIKASSTTGDLVADFFCGSGTSLVVAEKLGRRWIGCDLSKFSIHVTRKRLLEVPGCKPFQILNLGMYQKQKLVDNGNGGRRYFEFIRELYGAAPVQGFAYIHGRKGNRLVHIGPIDSFVSEREIRATAREAMNSGAKGIDILGWDFEMGLHDLVDSIIKEFGIDIKLKQIPLEVLEVRTSEKGKRLDEIRFFDLNYLDVGHELDGRKVTVAIRRFNIANPEFIPEDIRSSVRNFTSYIDFWAVDFKYDGDAFHNMRQQYRTKENPELKTKISFEYEEAGEYSILVKVVDIFGNDTNKLIPVKVS